MPNTFLLTGILTLTDILVLTGILLLTGILVLTGILILTGLLMRIVTRWLTNGFRSQTDHVRGRGGRERVDDYTTEPRNGPRSWSN